MLTEFNFHNFNYSDMTLQQKIQDVFIGKMVGKDLAFIVKGGLPLPTYVLENLFAYKEETIELGLKS